MKIPEATDYPDLPAIGILSLHEYRQEGQKHSRQYHKIIRILTPQGKEYMNLHVPCFSTCHIEARTIKPDGKILNLPAKDLYRNENLSGYRSPYFVAQFAMPGVEAGDIIEYAASVDYPIPLYLDDFQFSEPYPLLKGIFTLVHPVDDSYSYVRHSPQGGPAIHVKQSKASHGQIQYTRTTFVAEDLPAALEESFAPAARQDLPGIRLLLDYKNGRRFDIFKDWFSYGEFVASQIPASSVSDQEILQFAGKVTGDLQDIKAILSSIYAAADKQIQISDETLWMSGFEFRAPYEVLQQRSAAPHDFAVFLAMCFRSKRWSSDLILVNSHHRAEATRDRVFPPDLDLVFLNVKTPIGEFVLDCSRNGLPPFQLSSAGMSRFALGVPLFATKSRLSGSGAYTSRTSFRAGNRSHMELTATRASDRWEFDFRWFLGGEFQAEWVRMVREKGESELRARLHQELRSRLDVFDLRDVRHSFTTTGLEIKGKGSRAIRKIDALQILENDLWNSGFEVRPFLFENRRNDVLLPAAGEFSSSLRVRASIDGTTPESVLIESPPARYSLTFRKENGELIIEEAVSIRDVQVKKSAFPEFSKFLTQYYEKRFWALLLR